MEEKFIYKDKCMALTYLQPQNTAILLMKINNKASNSYKVDLSFFDCVLNMLSKSNIKKIHIYLSFDEYRYSFNTKDVLLGIYKCIYNKLSICKKKVVIHYNKEQLKDHLKTYKLAFSNLNRMYPGIVNYVLNSEDDEYTTGGFCNYRVHIKYDHDIYDYDDISLFWKTYFKFR